MKSTQFDADKHLGNQRFLILHGSQVALIDYVKERIQAHFKNKGYRKRVFETNSVNDIHELTIEIQNKSLFPDPKWFVLNYGGQKLSKETESWLCNLPTKLSQDQYAILIVHHSDRSSPKSKWFKHLSSQYTCVDCNPIYGRELQKWVQELLLQWKAQLSSAQISQLLQVSQHSLSDLVRIVRQIGLAYPSQPISESTYRSSLHCFASEPTFSILNTALNGNLKSKKLQLNHYTQEELYKLYWQTSKTLRLCRKIKELCLNTPINQAFSQAKIPPWQQKNLAPAIHRHSLMTLYAIQTLLAAGDGIIKGQIAGDLPQTIEQALLYLSGEQECPLPF
jgi:DNA polymerase III delta subunit